MLSSDSLLTATAALPYYAIPHLTIGFGLKIEVFGVLVALGVILGTRVLDKYAIWHRADDAHIRGLTWWLLVSGFIGAHVFDVLAYQWDKLVEDPLLLFKLWMGISSYGGFIGGAIGYAIYVWWKRLPPRLWADISAVGLLPAFTIGRIGCTIVHDHPGSPTTSALGFDYPLSFTDNLGYTTAMRLHNLALYEFAYLLPINVLILWLAFRKGKRLPAGTLAALLGLLYAPVRFFLDYLRPTATDPRYGSLTFAQWSSILALGVAMYLLVQLLRNGAPALTTDDPDPKKKTVPAPAAP
jgi:phosphatidylglycerol---prolipoprotein diacylglyceryl transferase